MNISLIIPVRNDAENLIRLLVQAADLGCFQNVIVIDDHSDIPLTHTMISPVNVPENWLSLTRNPKQMGPGPSRNFAIDLVKTDHLLYLDSDDLLTQELPYLLAELAGREFDFCLFKHHDSRMQHGQMPHDEAFWQAANLADTPLTLLDQASTPLLAQTANYPWNKIYRSEFLRQSDARCSDILLHEDVALHWQSFLYAKTIYCSSRIVVQHFVDDSAQRLTNLKGRERLAFFNVLPALFRQVRDANRPEITIAFLQFITGLLYWIEDNITPNLRRSVRRKTGAFISDVLREVPLATIASKNPELHQRLKDQRRRGRFIRLPKLRRRKGDHT